MNDITQFLFQPEGSPIKHKVRVVTYGGVPQFAGADVASLLGYANPAEAIADHCKRAHLVKHSELLGLPNRGLTVIPESDVYRLIMRSKLPAAEQFADWVVEAVLPSLRKHGGYIVGQETKTREQLMADAVLLANSVYEEERAKRLAAEAEVSQQALVIQEQAPKVVVYDEHVADSGLTKVHLYAGTLDGVNMLAVKRDLERLPRG